MKQLPNECFFAWVEEELSRTGSVRFRVKGVSMQPLLRNGRDEVEVRPVDPATVRPGDILLFRYRGRHILHRLIRQDGMIYYLRGDNAWSEERCVGTDNCRARRDCLPSPRERGACWLSGSFSGFLPLGLSRLAMAVLCGF